MTNEQFSIFQKMLELLVGYAERTAAATEKILEQVEQIREDRSLAEGSGGNPPSPRRR